MKEQGRNFDCATCIDAVKKLRRCGEDREDFTRQDGNIWPMYLIEGGPTFSFCPGKATWSEEAFEALQMLETTALLKAPLFSGSFMEQPAWYAEFVMEFLGYYEDMRSASRQRSMWGGSGGGKGQSGQGVDKSSKTAAPSRPAKSGKYLKR